MDMQTWAFIATVIATGIAVVTIMSRKIDTLESGLGERIDKLGSGLGERLGELRVDLTDIRAGQRALEQPFFEILLPNRPAPTGTDDPGA